MRIAQTAALWAVRIAGLFQIILGLGLWFGSGRQYLALHMRVGLLFVVSMWVLGTLALVTRGPRGLAVVTIGWGALVYALGVGQMYLVPTSAHWVVQLAHLVVGLAAIAIAGRLGRQQLAAPQAVSRPSPS